MENHFEPMAGAEGWQISNEPIMGMALKKASLEIFAAAGMPALRKKSLNLTAYFEFVLKEIFPQDSPVQLHIITPADPEQRGCQLSLKLVGIGRPFFDAMMAAGVMADFREPDVIRLAAVPLYNSYEDIFRAGQILKRLLEEQ
jgi:kynureninase